VKKKKQNFSIKNGKFTKIFSDLKEKLKNSKIYNFTIKTINESLEIKIIILLVMLLYISISTFNNNYIINNSSSMQVGIYKMIPIKGEIKKGDIIITKIPENIKKLVYTRGYVIPRVNTFLKRVAGTNVDKIEKKEDGLYINDKFIKKISKLDRLGRPLPIINNYTIKENEYFLLGDDEKSFDSTYFGAVNKSLFKSKAILKIKF
jgi:signal peptidase I